MNVFMFKLLLTPALIGSVSVLGRRWGPTITGLVVSLPLTSGPVVVFLALDNGNAFAAAAAAGILAGVASVAAFALAYGRLAFRLAWPATVLISWLLFLAATWALQQLTLPLVALFIGIVALLAAVYWLVPGKVTPGEAPTPPWWDIPARMVVATTFVVLLTAAAPVLGPRLSGLLAPFPIYASVLAVSAHHFEGAATAAHLIRGIVLGLFAFATFFLVVATLVQQDGIVVACVAASTAALALQGSVLWWQSRRLRTA